MIIFKVILELFIILGGVVLVTISIILKPEKIIPKKVLNIKDNDVIAKFTKSYRIFYFILGIILLLFGTVFAFDLFTSRYFSIITFLFVISNPIFESIMKKKIKPYI